jgi:UDP-N-acetylmuramate--alanine ligase
MLGQRGQRIHLIGIGGAGMSGLARMLHRFGVALSGSDVSDGQVVEELRAEGIHIWIGHRPELLTGNGGYLVRSAAVGEDDPEVRECERRGFTSLLYAEAVGRLSEGRRCLAIAGTHGKTTTTAMTVAAARGAGLDPSHLIGGEVPELGGNGYGGGDDVFIVEACEFNRSFLNLRPFGAAILNADHDHFDCYPRRDDLVDAYRSFVARIRPGGTVVVSESVPLDIVGESLDGVRVVRVGQGLFADLRATDVAEDLGRFSFVPMVHGRRLPRVQLAQPGRFQVHNALTALALVDSLGADLETACVGLGSFVGVRRRFEMFEGKKGTQVVLDYAHHPAEIKVVLRAARRRFPARPIVAVFQPHQHSRTWRLLDDFVSVLAEADHAVVAEVYAARERLTDVETVTATRMVEAIRSRGARADVGAELSAMPAQVAAQLLPNAVVLVLGAGNIDAILEPLLEVT